jgi:hypothetical protein
MLGRTKSFPPAAVALLLGLLLLLLFALLPMA